MGESIRVKVTAITNNHGWGIGLELVNEGHSVPYYAGSYYFPRSVRGSATKSIYKTIERACEYLPADREIVVEGTHPIFEHQKYKLLSRIRDVLGEETNVLVFHYKKLYGQGRALAEDALQHRSTIDERL
ncbi:hypothetical protein SAMN04487777_13222 [Priestia aryabhattai B8W22]|uniref:hypothetical protein n=1 Tax=Priestia aryabhattai TaxID=412384 RepID=UPI00088EEBD2|nr:hypothetical protein SAMN04487777_13222 [Priestia aryabhattai B8W22]